jgi:cytochrome P450
MMDNYSLSFWHAGHETTSTLITWLLHFISEPSLIHVQDKLRAEIDDVFAGREELDFDSLMAMPYLDMVIKEILRFNSPVTATVRTANKDDMVPLSKPYPSRDGKGTVTSVLVRKDQDLMIPVQVINKLESIWGPTANQFDPERWRDLPAAAKSSGMPSQMLSFLEGPRGCVGRVFALAESKALVCALLRTLKFESVGWEVEPKQGIVIQPRVIGQEELGMQMPLRISRV